MNISPTETTNDISTLFALDCDFQIIRKLREFKSPVFLVCSERKIFAMKLFPFKDGKPRDAYRNQARFMDLAHENIIRTIKVEDNENFKLKSQNQQVSYAVLELAEYGDFSRLLRLTSLFHDEILLRTYFHQLINGLQYLHSKDIAHLNLKPDNILLGSDLKLKISDFSYAYRKRDTQILSQGSENYRAPELKQHKCIDPQAADIYSAGIILFLFKTECFPYLEDRLTDGYDLQGLLRKNPSEFWSVHKRISKQEQNISDDFKKLFISMVKYDPVERATIEEIKKSKWFNGPVYTQDYLSKIMKPLLKDEFNISL